MGRTGRVRVGCSGWQYAHWRGDFYPKGLPVRAWLAHYAREFDTVELNGTFYRLPAADAVRAWHDRAPPRFCFAWKASRYITHNKKLHDARAPLALMAERARPLEGKLGPFLYQLPPRWNVDVERLRAFLEEVPARARHAFEFRDPSWYDASIFDLLRRAGAALCAHDMPGSATPLGAGPTGRLGAGPFVYIRFHGGAGHGGAYGARRLAPWATRLAEQATRGLDVYAYFNNDAGGHAPRDAATLRSAIARALGR